MDCASIQMADNHTAYLRTWTSITNIYSFISRQSYGAYSSYNVMCTPANLLANFSLAFFCCCSSVVCVCVCSRLLLMSWLKEDPHSFISVFALIRFKHYCWSVSYCVKLFNSLVLKKTSLIVSVFSLFCFGSNFCTSYISFRFGHWFMLSRLR